MAVAGISPTPSFTHSRMRPSSTRSQGAHRGASKMLGAILLLTASLLVMDGTRFEAHAAEPSSSQPATLIDAAASELAAEGDASAQQQAAEDAAAKAALEAAEIAKTEAAAKAEAEADMAKALEEANPNVTPLREAPASSKAAQSTTKKPKGLGGFSTDPTKPIEIEADSLEVAQDQQTATFIGNVKATQGTLILNAAKLKVSYAESADGNTEVTRIDATGAVHISSANDQSANGDWAIYQVKDETITMGDAVILRQGPNIIRGARLAINLATGRAKVDARAVGGASGGDGRVRGLFQPPKR